jgi:hypothetical protein
MRVPELRAALEAMEPHRLQALEILLHLSVVGNEGLDPAGDAAVIEAAVDQLEAQVTGAKDMVKRCSKLQATPSQTRPCGF